MLNAVSSIVEPETHVDPDTAASHCEIVYVVMVFSSFVPALCSNANQNRSPRRAFSDNRMRWRVFRRGKNRAASPYSLCGSVA
jgi:hypothetical protein